MIDTFLQTLRTVCFQLAKICSWSMPVATYSFRCDLSIDATLYLLKPYVLQSIFHTTGNELFSGRFGKDTFQLKRLPIANYKNSFAPIVYGTIIEDANEQVTIQIIIKPYLISVLILYFFGGLIAFISILTFLNTMFSQVLLSALANLALLLFSAAIFALHRLLFYYEVKKIKQAFQTIFAYTFTD